MEDCVYVPGINESIVKDEQSSDSLNITSIPISIINKELYVGVVPENQLIDLPGIGE